MQRIQLGQSDITLAPLGVGTWSWGDRLFWGYGNGYRQDDIVAAFKASVDAGVTFFDTAEIYGPHTSERMLGAIARSDKRPVVLASKFMPLPWRLSPRTLRKALDATLQRLGVAQLDLYQIHWPSPILTIPGLMDALADAVAEGKTRYVGVSNYSAEQMRQAHEALAKRGVALVSNQVEYSLFQRAPEVNGVLDACHELQITLIAYSPLAMGLLSGKYRAGVTPTGPRRYQGRFNQQNLVAIAPVIELLNQIGQQHGKKPAQVALNWLIQRSTLPIPGAKNSQQAIDNAGTLGWDLSADQVEALDRATIAWRK